MSISPLHSNKIAFTAERTQERKDAEKKVVTGGGAVAATTAAARAKATKSGFDMFASASRVSQGMQTVTSGARTANNVVKKSSSLWARVSENARWAKDAILNWGSNFKNMKYIKPLVESRVFKFGAGALGYGFGAVTLLSGLSDISKVVTDTVDEK
jgi:hypothetical protein